MSTEDEYERKPSDVLTITRVTAYERCPRQWGYIYINGVRSPPGWAMIAGSAMDDTLNVHHEHTIKGLNGLRGSALVDYYVGKLKNLSQETPPIGENEFDQSAMDGSKLLPMYEREVTPMVEPIAVQKEVEYEIGGRKYLGHIDLIRRATGGHSVISDHKFTSKTPSEDWAAKSLQLRAYDLAVNDPAHHVELINLVRLKREPKIVVRSHIVTPRDRQELLAKFSQTAALVNTMVFPQISPTSWACSPLACGCWSICRGRSEGPLPIHGERGL